MKTDQYDKSNMRQEIVSYPRQFKIGIEIARKTRIKKKVDKVLICGMGGSALPGDLLKMYLRQSEENIFALTNRNHHLPRWVDKKTLIVCISYSGNTEETLSCLREAIERKIEVVCISSGGEMAQICSQKKVPISLVPESGQARMILGFTFSALMKILNNCNLTKGLKDISLLEKSLNPTSLEERGKKIAEKIKGKIPLIYSSYKNKELSYIWKIGFNENSKIPAFSNCIPELNHNEIEGFKEENNDNLFLITIRDEEDEKPILKRIDLTHKTLKRKMEAEIVEMEKGDFFLKVFSNIILSYWTSYWLAIKRKMDPASTETIEDFKSKLKR
jgi:glucose/mannose-6-phosphate isomerase